MNLRDSVLQRNCIFNAKTKYTDPSVQLHSHRNSKNQINTAFLFQFNDFRLFVTADDVQRSVNGILTNILRIRKGDRTTNTMTFVLFQNTNN